MSTPFFFPTNAKLETSLILQVCYKFFLPKYPYHQPLFSFSSSLALPGLQQRRKSEGGGSEVQRGERRRKRRYEAEEEAVI